jgi:hypothetical protein
VTGVVGTVELSAGLVVTVLDGGRVVLASEPGSVVEGDG